MAWASCRVEEHHVDMASAADQHHHHAPNQYQTALALHARPHQRNCAMLWLHAGHTALHTCMSWHSFGSSSHWHVEGSTRLLSYVQLSQTSPFRGSSRTARAPRQETASSSSAARPQGYVGGGGQDCNGFFCISGWWPFFAFFAFLICIFVACSFCSSISAGAECSFSLAPNMIQMEKLRAGSILCAHMPPCYPMISAFFCAEPRVAIQRRGVVILEPWHLCHPLLRTTRRAWHCALFPADPDVAFERIDDVHVARGDTVQPPAA